MKEIAIFVAIAFPLVIGIFLPLILSGLRATEDRARARRLADAKMNARLLRFDI